MADPRDRLASPRPAQMVGVDRGFPRSALGEGWLQVRSGDESGRVQEQRARTERRVGLQAAILRILVVASIVGIVRRQHRAHEFCKLLDVLDARPRMDAWLTAWKLDERQVRDRRFAISRHLCRLMGGDLTVSTVKGQGSGRRQAWRSLCRRSPRRARAIVSHKPSLQRHFGEVIHGRIPQEGEVALPDAGIADDNQMGPPEQARRIG